MPGLLPVGATKTVNVKPGDDGKLLPTFGTYTINKVTDKPGDGKGEDSLLPAVATNTANLAQIWLSVMDKAKPNHQKLLVDANLVKLQGSKAILEVTPAYLQKFESGKEAIAIQAQKLKLLLSEDAVAYLAQAIGNDMTRAASELRKLDIYANGRKLELAEVKKLVPCQTQNSLQLAAAMREGKSHQVLQLLDDLLSRSQPLMAQVLNVKKNPIKKAQNMLDFGRRIKIF